MPKQFEVSSLTIVAFDLNSRQFDVTLNGNYAGKTDQDSIDLEDRQKPDDLNVIRYILSKLPAAYGNGGPVAFTVTVDDQGDIVVPAGRIVSGVAPSLAMRSARINISGGVTPAPAARCLLININSDDEPKLKTLPGVGPATAASIIKKRPFKTVDDLETVDGIGPVKMQDVGRL